MLWFAVDDRDVTGVDQRKMAQAGIVEDPAFSSVAWRIFEGQYPQFDP